MISPVSAFATYTWKHVGGDPLIKGGVWTVGDFSYKMLNSHKVRSAISLVRKANGQPSWVISAADKQLSAGNIHKSTISRGTKVGAMSYGLARVRVVKNTIYRGQYSKLPYYYVNSSKTYPITKNGAKYLRTVTYRVSMAKKCGNVFIFHKSTKDVLVVCPPPEHKLSVIGSYDPEMCLNRDMLKGYLVAEVLSHSDNDIVCYKWTVNGISFTTNNSTTLYNLCYNKTYTVTLETRDEAGHVASATLPPLYFEGPGNPPE